MIADLAYRSTVRAVRMASPVLASGGSKLARGIRGRRGAVERLRAWARAARDPELPLLWLHAPSVGEGLQAKAVLEAVKDAEPAVQTAFTHFSPSAEALARRMGADVADYLPWDLRGESAAVLDALRPTVLAFTKTEVWPVLAREAEARGVLLVLVAATLPPGSSRLSPLAGPLLRRAFGRLSALHAVSEEDGRRFGRLGVPAARVSVTGDPGIDSAAERARAADPDAPHLRPFPPGRPRLIAGSTWPPDEAVLLPACRAVRERFGDFQLVVAPHEPTPRHVAALLGRLGQDGWRPAPLAQVEAAGASRHVDAVVVDRVGVLASLYTVGHVGYVGGGFHRKGLHSVLEPAAAGLPVCFGPRHHNARAAAELVGAGAARVVRGVEALSGVLVGWLGDEESRRATGRAASGYLQAHRGAARRSARLLLELMGR